MKPVTPLSRLLAGVLTLLTGALLLSAPTALAAGLGAGGGTGNWTGTWSTAPTTVPAGDTTTFRDQTIRQVVHASIGGDALRIRFSNEFGTAPLVIGEARVARQASDGPGSRAMPGTDRPLTFGGRTRVTVPPGEPLLSDPVPLRLPEAADLLISVYLPESTRGSTVNAFSAEENYLADGNVTRRTDITPTATTDRWYFLTGVSVLTRPGPTAAVVTLGDSLTAGSSVSTNHRWSDHLAQRLRDARGLPDTGVLNAGISGNRLLRDPNPPADSPAQGYAAYFGESGLKRFDRDVLAQPGVRSVIVLLGINDIGQPGTVSAPASERVTAAEVIDGHRRLIARAHAHGIEVIGGTITPFRDDTLGFYSPENEVVRQQVNAWIRTSGAYDAVADFDAAVRDPAQPDRLNPAYDSGDHLHLNDAGNAALATAVPLAAFRPGFAN
ncbi:SGNH/GDSL hydrolase family protein [Streptomyces litchfieldiae]|uniref:SGNH/GDSL hydrolase family protein n=1 Tax=Streptomyces litchfieldiae TaxID=3075543 RepID=A0ABU2MPL0_9ACTN|nr:SGNH/GDSL hydrolase family protein [Streptomyces sp. DSM 44938]MDT0343563.1 SGNH/GDSL hydrolase family protein [Streptomyces sp. DSM 44938]